MMKIYMIPVGVGFGVLVIAFLAFSFASSPPLDSKTKCEIGRPVDAITVVLIDRSDKISRTERDGIRRIVREASRILPKNGLFIMISLNPADPRQPFVHMSVCSPGPVQLGGLEALATHEKLHQKKWQDTLGKPIDQVLDEVLDISTQKTSPIIESIVEITNSYEFRNARGARSIYLHSDMIQNTDKARGGWSMLAQGSSGRMLQSFNSSDLADRIEREEEVLEIFLTVFDRVRYARIQRSEEFSEVWKDIFGKMNADVKILSGPRI